jgi:L-ascorbate 6-phosphate lactonase
MGGAPKRESIPISQEREVGRMDLMEQVKAQTVARGTVALWWLGQASFILKSPNGLTAAIDPYLTNSCKDGATAAGFDCDRRIPPLIQPENFDVDLIVLTHSHQDHCDPDTLMRHRGTGFRGPYLAPGETKEKLVGLGFAETEVLLTWPNKEHCFGDVRVKSTFAIPPAGDDVTHLGYLMFVDSGPTVYFTGDTDYHDILAYVRQYKPNVMVTVINGAFHNLGPNEATKLTQLINPDVVIPCHYDLFADNSVDPRIFQACLRSAGLAHKYRRLDHGQVLICTGWLNGDNRIDRVTG